MGPSNVPAEAWHEKHPYRLEPKLHTDCRVRFNTSWGWSTSGEAGKLDVQNIATHELGHWLLLGDLYGAGDTEKTMYGSTAYGETKKRTLESDDIAGVRHLYP